MKNVKFSATAMACMLLVSGISLASGSDDAPVNGVSRVMMPVYKTMRDCDITYYIIKDQQ